MASNETFHRVEIDPGAGLPTEGTYYAWVTAAFAWQDAPITVCQELNGQIIPHWASPEFITICERV